MNEISPIVGYVGTAVGSFIFGVAVGVFTNFLNGRISHLSEFRKAVYGEISKIQISTFDGDWKEVLKKSGRLIYHQRVALAEDIQFWRRRRFQNTCLQYSNHQIIREFAENAADKLFESKDVDPVGEKLSDWEECDRHRAWAINCLNRIAVLARFSPFPAWRGRTVAE
jgi:hypothetical protein